MPQEGFKHNHEPFTYNTVEQLQERDPLLNKFLIDTAAYSVAGAVVGLGVGVVLRRPCAWSLFFAGVGAHTAYARGPVKLKWFHCCHLEKQNQANNSQ